MNGLADTGRNVIVRCDWLFFWQTVERKHIELGLKMTAVFNNGEAKPIRIQISVAVFELLAKEWL